MYVRRSWLDCFLNSPLTEEWKDRKLLQTLMDLNKAIKDDCVDGKPLFIADPDQSIFKIMTENEYQSCSTQKIQEYLWTQHIVVKDRQIPNHKFNENGLRTLRPLNEPVTIHGQFQMIVATCLFDILKLRSIDIHWRVRKRQWKTERGYIATVIGFGETTKRQNFECAFISSSGCRLWSEPLLNGSSGLDADPVCSVF